MTARALPDRIALLVADVDGTLVTPDKAVTADAVAAVGRLEAAAIGFTLVSARPPRGMATLISTLGVRLPFAAFNGGAIVGPDMNIIRAHHLSRRAARATLDLLTDFGVDPWVFADDDWRLRNASGPRVADHRHTVGFDPVVVQDFEDVIDRIDKIVVVSERPADLAEIEKTARALLAGQATINISHAFYLDFTHPQANKGQAVRAVCEILSLDPFQVAVIGDMVNDVSMFQVAGFAIAMGEAPEAVKARADAVTRSNADEGFSNAVDRLILTRAPEKRAAE
jgi:Cof subfamily protein (haloacid dehalogenase superfamily)